MKQLPKPGKPVWPLTTEEREHCRTVVTGNRTDDGDRCTVVLVHERDTGDWGVYPHGFTKFGVRLSDKEAVKLARKIIDDRPRPA